MRFGVHLLRGLLPALLALSAFAGGARPALATPGLEACTGVVTPDANGLIGIATPGTWCLDQDFAVSTLSSTNRYFISITSDDVTLDCRGHRIEFTGSYAEPRAVKANQKHHVAVRNCDIRGFWLGITLHSSGLATGDYLVEDNLFVGNERSIEIGGNRSLVRRNRILDSVGAPVLVISYGGNDVLDNLIDGVATGQFALWVVDTTGGRIRGNTIRGLPPGTVDHPFEAINIGGSSPDSEPRMYMQVSDNVLVGGPLTKGVECLTHPSAKVADNVITGFTVPVDATCLDAGDNDISP